MTLDQDIAEPYDAAEAEVTRADFDAIAAVMHDEARIHLPPSKVALVHSRLGKRLRVRGLSRFADYVELIRTDAEERGHMVVSLTTNHTHFFREEHHFEHLRETLMPIMKARAESGQAVRMWSAGCSSGEEVYSIAMTLLGQDRGAAAWTRHCDLRLLATDIAPTMVAATRRGVYPAASVEAIPSVYRRLWMQGDGDNYVMGDEARSLVTANVLNLFEPWPMRHRYDAIFCRNVMIYFDDPAKIELETRLIDMLIPGGFLYIGHSERLMGPASSQMSRAGQTVFVKQGGAHA